ncbi:MAG: hypothetical protein RXQ74_01095 [Caldivirga sp.]
MLEVSFAGRRSIFNELSRMVTGSIKVRYIDSSVITAVGNSVGLLDYYVDNVECVGNCIRVGKDAGPVELMSYLINAVVKMLNGGLTKMGIDYGTERTGVVLVYDNTLLMGSVLTPSGLMRLLRLINSKLDSVAVGDSPAVHSFLGEGIGDLCAIAGSVLIVDELESSRLRGWVSVNGLSDDVADAYAIALTKPKVTIRCP